MLTDDSLGATSLTLFGIKPVFFFFFDETHKAYF